MPEIAFPTFRESFYFNGATKQSGVVLLMSIERGDIADFYTVFAAFDEFDRIIHSDFALLQDGKIEAGTLARQESFDDVRAAESDAELVARHARLGHHQA